MTLERARFEWDGGSVSGAWHHPARGKTYLVLGHGAGGPMQTPALVSFAEAMCDRGIGTVRFNFPYTEAGRKAPDPQPRLISCYRAVATAVAGKASELFLGGRSMGGRIASHVVAEGLHAQGLVFLSYPLHPPGKPERIRDAHLGAISAPMLFVQGSRDAFARPDLLAATMGRLPRANLHKVEGADHGLKVPGRDPTDVTKEIADIVATWIHSHE